MASFKYAALLTAASLLAGATAFGDSTPPKSVPSTVLKPAVPWRPLTNAQGVKQAVQPSGPPYEVTTLQLRAVGGPNVMVTPFAPVAVTTPQLRAVGGPNVAVATFDPVVVTTQQLSAVGGP